MRIIITDVFTMDGEVNVDGHGGDYNSGGGSGGSIWLTVSDFRGHGKFSANGGMGASNGGGGSGGRFAAHTSVANQFRGALEAHGVGGTNGGDIGGPGSVFIEDEIVSGVEFSTR